MIACDSGAWTSLFGQSDLDLAQYIHPPSEESLLNHDFGPEAVDDLIRALGGDAPITPPPSGGDVHFNHEPVTTLIPTPVLDPTPPSTPKSDDERDKDNVPRYKRPAHKRAEVRRRGKIKTNLDDLRELLPPIHNQRKSESLILSKAADHCKNMKAAMAKHEDEKARLRAEIAALSAEIDTFQKDLPAMGLKAEGKAEGKSMDTMYDDYVREQTKKDWKFWIFSFMMRPLFETYTTGVSTSTIKEFASSVSLWTEETLGLTNLRSVFTKGVLRISKETSILTKPEALQNEAVQSAAIS